MMIFPSWNSSMTRRAGFAKSLSPAVAVSESPCFAIIDWKGEGKRKGVREKGRGRIVDCRRLKRNHRGTEGSKKKEEVGKDSDCSRLTSPKLLLFYTQSAARVLVLTSDFCWGVFWGRGKVLLGGCELATQGREVVPSRPERNHASALRGRFATQGEANTGFDARLREGVSG